MTSTNFTVTETAAPAGTTTVGNGTDPGPATLAPGGAATMLDAFSLQASAGTDTVTAVQVALAAGTSAGIGLIEITDSAGVTVYGSVATPTDTQNITLLTNIIATTTLTEYRVRITPKSHLAMPVPPGATYTVTGTVNAITSSYTKVYSDATSATITIDNLSPANATAFSGVAGSTQVVLNWTNPADADYAQAVVLRNTVAVADTPAEGAAYAVTNPIGTSTVACVVNTPATTCTDTGLTNGTAYYYKIFTKDTRGNYSAGGTAAGPYTPTCAAGAPTGLAAAAGTTTTSIPLTWTGGVSTNYFNVYRNALKISTDNTVLTGAYTDTTGSPSVTYSYYVKGYNTAGLCESGPSNTLLKSTLATVPSAPTVTNVNATTVTVAVGADANSAEATYAIRINGGIYTNQFVQAGGTIGAAAAWQTKAAWGTTTITGLSSVSYTFDVEARNGNGELIVTVFGPSASVIPHVALPSTITSCAGCHQYSPTFADGTARNTPVGQFQGSHKPHVQDNGYACSKCHIAPATTTSVDFKHRNGTVQIVNPIDGAGTYSKASFTQTNAAFSGGTCSATHCHGTSSGTWGTNTAYATCVKCHGVATSSAAQFTADTKRAAPGYTAAVAPVGPGVDTAGLSLPTTAKAGAHDAHLRGIDTISSPIACTECHANVTTSVTFTGHMNGVGNLDWGTLAKTGGKTPLYAAPNCTSTYCHTANRPAGALAGQGGLSTVTSWTNPALIGNTTVTDTCINQCHEMPPRGGVVGDSHAGLTAPGTYTTPASLAACSSNSPATGCHPTINAAPTSMATIFFDSTKHVNGSVEGGSCTGCHAAAVNSPAAQALDATVTTRRAVSGEFGLAWSHKRSAVPAGTVINNDCCVCHMEGDAAAGSINATYHKNGKLELRDPDLGTTIKGVTWGGAGAGGYTSTAIDAAPVRFSRNLASNVIETDTAAIQINLCLKCHDTDGAASALAQVPGGTAAKPFNTTVTYTTTPTNPSGVGVTAGGVLGGVTDINESFKTTNSSYHPVSGKQNNWYAKLTRMFAPWNVTGRGATADTTSWGDLISCWDCHALSTDAGTITRTVTAHGAASTLRGVAMTVGLPVAGTNQVTLCIVCHNGYDTNVGTNHGLNSAFNSGGASPMDTYLRYGCNICHGSGYATAVVRPVRAMDVHGVNILPTGGLVKEGRWAGGSFGTPAQIDARPYAFIRNTSDLAEHTPLKIGGTTYSAGTLPGNQGCAMIGGTTCAAQGHESYTPGGVF